METHKFKMILRESMITVFCALLFTQGSEETTAADKPSFATFIIDGQSNFRFHMLRFRCVKVNKSNQILEI